jgi:hypothetical protein
MKNMRILHWLPRVLSILFIIFISLFALDVFGGPKWFLALLIHLIPSFLLVIFTIVSWKHGLLGGIIFCIAGIAFLVSSHFKAWVVSVPAVFIGLLFIAEKILFKNRLENKSR